MHVKMAEFAESVSIILSALDKMPGGPLSLPVKFSAAGSASGWAESPRGEILHWVEIGATGASDGLK